MIALHYKIFYLFDTYYTDTYYTALISTTGNKNYTNEEYIVIIFSMQDKEMKRYQGAFKKRQLYYGENHRSVGDSYHAIDMEYQTGGETYKAMLY